MHSEWAWPLVSEQDFVVPKKTEKGRTNSTTAVSRGMLLRQVGDRVVERERERELEIPFFRSYQWHSLELRMRALMTGKLVR